MPPQSTHLEVHHLPLPLCPSLALPDNVSIFLNYSKTQIICCYMPELERDRPGAAAAGPIGARFLDRAIVQITPSLTPINFGQRPSCCTHTHTDRHSPSGAISYWEVPVSVANPLLLSPSPSFWLAASGFGVVVGFSLADSQRFEIVRRRMLRKLHIIRCGLPLWCKDQITLLCTERKVWDGRDEVRDWKREKRKKYN